MTLKCWSPVAAEGGWLGGSRAPPKMTLEGLSPPITKGPENKLIYLLLTYFNAALALGYRIKSYSCLVHVQHDCRGLNCYILHLFYHVLDKMKRRQVHLDEAWSLKRDKIKIIEAVMSKPKTIQAPLPTANCSAENLP